MQLKRDTDYALRIMICIAEGLKISGKQEGVALSSVVASTGIPIVTFNRVCGRLEEKGLIRKEVSKEGEKWLYPCNDFWGQSLLSIGEAAEGNMEIFAVFDRNSYIAQTYGEKLKKTQKNLDKVFSEATMAALVCD